MKLRILKNYLGFIEELRKSKRPIITQLFQISSSDSRTNTGSNLRNILLLTDHSRVETLSPASVEFLVYKDLAVDEQWKVELAKDIIDMKEDLTLAPEGWEKEELNDILTFLCTDWHLVIASMLNPHIYTIIEVFEIKSIIIIII